MYRNSESLHGQARLAHKLRNEPNAVNNAMIVGVTIMLDCNFGFDNALVERIRKEGWKIDMVNKSSGDFTENKNDILLTIRPNN